ncbi:MAG TPA: alpha/beta hydrolase [Gemmatimonadaceae bacterium]
MDLITSPDGTPIAVWRSGEGSRLLLVHGATADHSTTWRFVQPEFERRFTVYTMDRRGRGRSGDTLPYDLRREAEDIAAVVDAIGAPVDVLGHSYGALCALEAALLASGVRRLVLYEGVPLRGEDGFRPGIIDHLDELIAAGKVEEALVAMYRDLVEMSSGEIDIMKSNADAWAVRLRNVQTMPREARVEQSYRFTPERFVDMKAPALLLVGGDSPQRELENAQAVAAGLHNSTVVVLPGQQHVAMYTAPELFVRVVEDFLTA